MLNDALTRDKRFADRCFLAYFDPHIRLLAFLMPLDDPGLGTHVANVYGFALQSIVESFEISAGQYVR
ncbi:hypothetical protein M408DRAFT_331752 [Serendipita vermifera MAFF 305830]|uniref:Uncharacterized protein n=1 Tax=Serendipita vermifera MAFF 305830 TaxID=933852 RepID=A0A0C3AX20_SERVB|nr:hypothetical protein M408DRAFT_331752 [Serendipita vermifera MAFF 305830]